MTSYRSRFVHPATIIKSIPTGLTFITIQPFTFQPSIQRIKASYHS